MIKKNIPASLLEKWLKAWSLSRKLPLPVKYKSGFMVEVGYLNQKRRYVFTELNDDLIELSKSIDKPGIFLKFCSSPDKLKNRISPKWVVQPQGYLMSCFHKMNISDSALNANYKIESEHYNSTYVIRIVTKDGELACIGRVVLIDDLAIYDRISTEPDHQRMGLATFLMKELEKIVLTNNVSHNLLVATEEGKLFYQSIGWKIESLYTSLVIPEEDK